MKNAKSIVAATLIFGGLFLTSCSSSSKTGCYYSAVEKEQQKEEKLNTQSTFIVHKKDVTTE